MDINPCNVIDRILGHPSRVVAANASIPTADSRRAKTKKWMQGDGERAERRSINQSLRREKVTGEVGENRHGFNKFLRRAKNKKKKEKERKDRRA
ncbi:hypothetical protein PUN28_004995 [Cardiocondyla obscurior]|uniref:Uncharacterized protein n=1 Tax=Cardiocondyla obscurior TaxID=286306 RepID=A0AAW2GDJ1_9HYME